jgi:hypothetical protein
MHVQGAGGIWYIFQVARPSKKLSKLQFVQFYLCIRFTYNEVSVRHLYNAGRHVQKWSCHENGLVNFHHWANSRKVKERFDYPEVCPVFPQSKYGNSSTPIEVSTNICEKDQQDAHFISFIYFNYTILYMFRANKIFIRRLLLYTQHIAFSTHFNVLATRRHIHAWKTLHAACTVQM